MTEEKTTARDYVKKMAKRGRTDKEILAVALCSHWKPLLEDIRSLLHKRGDYWRKKGREERRQRNLAKWKGKQCTE